MSATPQADENEDGKLLSEQDAWAERMEGVWNEILQADTKGTRPRITLPGFPIHVRQKNNEQEATGITPYLEYIFCKGLDRCFANVFAPYLREDLCFSARMLTPMPMEGSDKLCCPRAFVVGRTCSPTLLAPETMSLLIGCRCS